MLIRNRLQQHIPIIKCLTCGKIARQRSVVELEDPALRNEKRKTWHLIIKPSFNVYAIGAQKHRNKRIFYAALLQRCIERKHKLKVIHLNNINFHKTFDDTLKEDERRKEKRIFKRKKHKLIKGEFVNCASCNKHTSIYDVCMKCARCLECCNCKNKKKIKRTKEVIANGKHRNSRKDGSRSKTRG